MHLFWMLMLKISLLNCKIAEKVFLTDTSGFNTVSKSWSKEPYNELSTCAGSWEYKKPFWQTCYGSDKSNQSCLLKSNSYNLGTFKDVNTIFVSVELQNSFCKTSVQNCNSTMELAIYIGPPDEKASINLYKTEVIPREIKKQQGNEEFYLTKDLFSFNNFKNTDVVQVAIRASNYCGVIIDIKIYYYVCPTTTDVLVTFPKRASPHEYNSPLRIDGECINGFFENNNKSYMECFSNGDYQVYGKCICKEGFEPKDFLCRECSSESFKQNVGNTPCQKCGLNSNSYNPWTSCICHLGYFRAIRSEKNYSETCYKPPSVPEDINVFNITSQSAYLKWRHPKDGSAVNGYYFIECVTCSDQDTFPKNTTKTEIFLHGLGSFGDYSLKISYRNFVFSLTNKFYSEVVNFKTLTGKPGEVLNFQKKLNQDSSVTISWKPPFSKGGPNLKYSVKYDGKEIITFQNSTNIKSGAEDRTYKVEIRAITSVDGKELYGPALMVDVQVKGGVKLGAALGAAFGVLFFIVLLFILGLYIWKKRHPMYFQAVRMEDGTVKLPSGPFKSQGKVYVDPTTYKDVDDAVEEFAYELERKDLKFGTLLGGGEFAEVYKGTLLRDGKPIDVAIKILKNGASKHDRDDFLGEAAILGQFADQNVICLEGVILRDKPNLIVLEYMANGALDKFLQENDNQFTTLQLLGMARGVASGMKYLSEMGFIHRDLAARNILVDELKNCKVADFGMSRKINIDETYDTKGGKIPVRWTAPEAVQFKKFTSASDMWSYGVLLWEIMSYGERPYWEWGNYEVLERINSGYRLPPPMGCPKVIHNLMLNCWNKDRSKRPKFSSIVILLEKWIRNSDLLTEIAPSVVTKADENLDYSVLLTITKWLEAIGMEKYATNFLDKGYATPRQVIGLTIDDLEELGIGPIGHRKKIFKIIQSTKAQIEGGFNKNRHASVSSKLKLVPSLKK
ncbi:ephrin type-A receptor 8-like precursor [Hydra vulgaris]|uniref:receptor protein-tyrosine kinase n=1 Tax=Hydra vulgaris TaxID=6087 RepID=R9X0X1_HYDVU|nr:ephrin type-A receptor 8-like precursor [Hydra vulgaris]AGO06064.1 Eph2 protein [Hydra vulgaris]